MPDFVRIGRLEVGYCVAVSVFYCYLPRNDLQRPLGGPFPVRWQEFTDTMHGRFYNLMTPCTMQPPNSINNFEQCQVSGQQSQSERFLFFY